MSSVVPKPRPRCGKYKLSNAPLQVSRRWKALFFCCFQLPAALLWVANAVVNVVVIRYFWRSDSIFLCVAFGIGAAVQMISACGQALDLVLIHRQEAEDWLGFRPKFLLIPPLTVLFPLFFPALLWLHPYPNPQPDSYHSMEEEAVDGGAKVEMESVYVKAEVADSVDDMELNPIGAELRREYEDPVEGAPDDCGERPTFRQPLGGPPQTRHGESVIVPPGMSTYRAVLDIEAASKNSAYWHLLWDSFRSPVQQGSWQWDGNLGLWHLLGFAAGALRAMRDPAFNDATYSVCITGFLLKAVYMIVIITAQFCSESLSPGYGVFGVALFVHDLASNAFSAFLCGSFGLSVFNSLTPAPGDESKDLHCFGLNGFAAFKAIQSFIWFNVGAAVIGVAVAAVPFGMVAAAYLKTSTSLGEKVCTFMRFVVFAFIAVPHQQVMRTLTPSLMYPLFEFPREPPVDCAAFLRLFHFVTANSNDAVRVRRMYFLLREELCDRIDDFWRGEHFQELDVVNGSDDGNDGDETRIKEIKEFAVDPHITKLYQLLSTRPFSTQPVEEMYRAVPPEWATYYQIVSVGSKLNMVGGFLQFVFPFLFVPSVGASWSMMTLFVGKCISLVVIGLSTPAALSYRRFRRDMSPLRGSITTSSSLPLVERDNPGFVAFRWIARYFRTIDIPSLAAAPTTLLPSDIMGRVGEFLHPSELLIPPDVGGDRFEEEFAADAYELPLWDGQLPKPCRSWTDHPTLRTPLHRRNKKFQPKRTSINEFGRVRT